jgi:pyruvate formate lyase activating enzyme
VCGLCSGLVSEEIGVCIHCIRSDFERVREHIENVHKRTRREHGLPETPPRAYHGIPCGICVNRCAAYNGDTGYCGVRTVRKGPFTVGNSKEGMLDYYFDRLPTNCVASPVCPAGSRCGYPEYSYTEGPEYGYKNLAVFFTACSFDCLYCQNWHFRTERNNRPVSVETLAGQVDGRTACICFFGGDPTPQLPYAIGASKCALKKKNRVLRICWETNGSMNESLLKQMLLLSLRTGGIVKFDLKAWDEGAHLALTGVTNKRTLQNFETAS